ncbi:MAG: 1,6-anhydro-N-acetylmuramyl-L-alanine amidase AmpD [Piscirickettsiaceae bacterium]|nr:MAG: 1,6-anhydro-N-acetylmuramyl-L-alanine amidase AmpD [Piscirickettsiaceae bacterium]PCI70813.1 MAG: 1,6-anhydro-N-acetylmuramyl-L-alanine amidase AmpD [Piscirickettsiaceae bacterium]
MKNVIKSISNGSINSATQLSSPNKNERPDISDIRLIIIHNISLPPDQFGSHWIDHFFLNKLDPTQHPYFEEIHQLEVSSHLLIRRDGSMTQYVPFHQRAWHAGLSSYDDCDNCNDFSIGIELEGADHIPYTEEQYIELAHCCKALLNAYPAIPEEAIVGHCDVAPGRKTDPGESFDWGKFRGLLSSL